MLFSCNPLAGTNLQGPTWPVYFKGLRYGRVTFLRTSLKDVAICDPDGQSAWVHRRTVDGARTVFRVKAQALPLDEKPDPRSAVRAFLAPRAVADLGKCSGGWCEVNAGGVRGWAPEGELWGVGDAPHCR